MKKLIKKLEDICSYSNNCFLFLLLYFINPGHRFEEVKKRCLIPQHPCDDSISDRHLAKELFEAEIERAQKLDEKNKVLLTIAALFLAGLSALGSRISQPWLFMIAVVPVFFSVYLIIVHFQVEGRPVPDIQKWDQTEKSKRASTQAKDLSDCAKTLRNQTDYKIGIYRAASRLILMGLLGSLPAFIFLDGAKATNSESPVNIAKDDTLDCTNEVIEKNSNSAACSVPERTYIFVKVPEKELSNVPTIEEPNSGEL